MTTPRTLLGILLTAILAVAVALPAAGAATPTPDHVPGIVDIFTDLGYSGSAAAGTGIVLSSSGEILTNNHVIRGATRIRVTVLDSGKRYTGSVVGYSLANDIAVLRLNDASGLQPATFGRSASLKVGDAVAGYGNAGGAGGAPSVAAGKIVSLHRSLQVSDDQGGSEQLHGLIETDASLEPGDSGGPLVDANGKVVGVDTAASSSFAFESGLTRGFAIPIDFAKKLASQILAGKRSATVHVGKTAFLGLSVQAQSDFFGQTSSGLVVAQVVPGSPIARIGLTAGSIVTRFDGRVVNTPSRLTSLVVTRYPGDKVPIRWIDEVGTAHSATLTLASGPPQ